MLQCVALFHDGEGRDRTQHQLFLKKGQEAKRQNLTTRFPLLYFALKMEKRDAEGRVMRSAVYLIEVTNNAGVARKRFVKM